MTALRHTTGFTWLAVTLIGLVAAPLFAEDTSKNNNNSSGTGAGSVSNPLDNPSMPTVTASTPAPNKNDRAQSSAAAVAMALAGSAQQKVACMMMMNEAMKEENSTTKAMMMALAAQQCAQADETAANAYKNKEGQKLVSGSDIPKQSELKVGSVPFGQGKVTEAEVPKISYLGAKGSPEDTGKDLQNLVSAYSPTLGTTGTQTSGTGADLNPPIQKLANEGDFGFSSLKPIEGGTVKYDDRPKDAQSAPGMGAMLGSFGATGSGSSTGSGKTSDKSDSSGPTSEDALRKPASAESSGSGGGSVSGASDGSSKDFKEMFADLLGGGASPDANAATSEIASTQAATDSGKDVPNIFEYASYRYRKLAYEKGSIRPMKIASVKLPKASAIARASRELTSGVKKIDTPEKQ